MKYNVKGYKNTHFTKIERNTMDGYDISGYVNSDKDKSFTAGIRSTEDFQFDGDITSSNNLEVLYHNNIKSVSEIKRNNLKRKRIKMNEAGNYIPASKHYQPYILLIKILKRRIYLCLKEIWKVLIN